MAKGKRLDRWTYQVHKHMSDNLNKIGVSKKDSFENGDYEGIHGKKTFKDYRYWADKYVEYVKDNYTMEYKTKEWNNITDIPRDIQKEYILEKMDEGCSNYSLKSIVSALNKVFNQNQQDKWNATEDFGIVRSYTDIERSRDFSITDAQETHNADQIQIAKGFGLRRNSICRGEYAVKSYSFYRCGEDLYVDVIEKGGRFRSVVCLDNHREAVEEVLERYGDIREQDYVSKSKEDFKAQYRESDNDTLFNRYDRNIDNHHYRGEYAKNLYNQLVEEKGEEHIDFRGYDSEILREVSQNLGHNRIDIVVYHYLR